MKGRAGLEFTGSAPTVGSWSLESEMAGLILGYDQRGGPVMLQLFRAEPTRVLMVDQGWLQRLLILRALAVGARVVVDTTDSVSWSGFGESVTGVGNRFYVASPDEQVIAPGSISQPTLFVVEGHLRDAPTLGPWQAQLTVAAWFGEYLAPALPDSDLVMLRRLSAREIAAAGALMHADVIAAAALDEIPADGVVIYQAGGWRSVRLVCSSVEHRLFGPPG